MTVIVSTSPPPTVYGNKDGLGVKPPCGANGQTSTSQSRTPPHLEWLLTSSNRKSIYLVACWFQSTSMHYIMWSFLYTFFASGNSRSKHNTNYHFFMTSRGSG